MGKRFEGEEPTYMEMLEAFHILGLDGVLGQPGDATAFAARFPMTEYVEFTVVPGAFSAKEVSDLCAWAA